MDYIDSKLPLLFGAFPRVRNELDDISSFIVPTRPADTTRDLTEAARDQLEIARAFAPLADVLARFV